MQHGKLRRMHLKLERGILCMDNGNVTWKIKRLSFWRKT